MNKSPFLQLALDVQDLATAIETTRCVAPAVDVIEAGTLLCLSEGMHAVRALRSNFSTATIVADVRVVRAGRNIAQMAFDAGANWITVVGEAPVETLTAALEVAEAYGGEVQIELHQEWSNEQAARWRELGVRQVILHCGVEVGEIGHGWTPEALDTIRRLADMGFRVTATGGISASSISAFRDVPVSTFIAGRSVVQAENPLAAAQDIRTEISATYA